MKICLVTPAAPASRAGNRTTAVRWATILRSLGHTVEVCVEFNNQPVDLMLALHAWRSADSIKTFSENYPERPLIVALTGTDAYKFIHSHPQTTLHSIHCADRLVGLHDLIALTLPTKYRDKLRVIYQSAQAIKHKQPVKRHFRICVAGHLRDVKDSLRPAYAVRSLPKESRIQVEHFGKAQTPAWATKAQQEMAINPRYRWHGEVTHSVLRKKYASSHLLVLPSRMEGGANVISEALVAQLPVITSRIDGSVPLPGSRGPPSSPDRTVPLWRGFPPAG